MKHPNDKAATPKADAMPSRGGSYHYDESGKHVRTVDPTKQPDVAILVFLCTVAGEVPLWET